jgi:hypothetical protein
MKKKDRSEKIVLLKSSPISERISVIKILYEKAESKVSHADNYRQKNLNYALIIFAGFFATAIKFNSKPNSIIISVSLTLIMILFAIWDRQKHIIKHRWQYISKLCYNNIIDLTNNNNQDIVLVINDPQKARKAEWFGWPILYYLLIIASIVLTFIFSFTNWFQPIIE